MSEKSNPPKQRVNWAPRGPMSGAAASMSAMSLGGVSGSGRSLVYKFTAEVRDLNRV